MICCIYKNFTFIPHRCLFRINIHRQHRHLLMFVHSFLSPVHNIFSSYDWIKFCLPNNEWRESIWTIFTTNIKWFNIAWNTHFLYVLCFQKCFFRKMIIIWFISSSFSYRFIWHKSRLLLFCFVLLPPIFFCFSFSLYFLFIQFIKSFMLF